MNCMCIKHPLHIINKFSNYGFGNSIKLCYSFIYNFPLKANSWPLFIAYLMIINETSFWSKMQRVQSKSGGSVYYRVTVDDITTVCVKPVLKKVFITWGEEKVIGGCSFSFHWMKVKVSFLFLSHRRVHLLQIYQSHYFFLETSFSFCLKIFRFI